MRLWSIHPKYLDRAGLIALWREALLAKKVLQGRTRGYRNHPQLDRFKRQTCPVAAISSFLLEIWKKGRARGYRFDGRKTGVRRASGKIPVTSGQLEYEFALLKKKLGRRDRKKLLELSGIKAPTAHPLFRIKKGKAEPWERIKG
ncbi:MAG: pyrimidine dimer DNA glycosylase/endonuclease V [Candidatus Micrarchaeota archaeon]